MKFKPGLTIATLLFMPGWYAIAAWTIADARNKVRSLIEMSEVYERALPVFGLSFTNTILVLLALSVAGLVTILRMDPETARPARLFRISIGVFGALSTAALCFALM